MKLTPITSIKRKPYNGIVHDLTVEDNHSYNINGLIVHNSICSTRLNCGVGLPQLTAIMDCARIKEDTLLIADGGIKYNGDIAKAIGAGADLVMLGKVLAATDLAGGECYDKNKELIDMEYLSPEYTENGNRVLMYKSYRGMASNEARQNVLSNASIEGVAGLIRYTGMTKDIMHNIKLNLQSTLSYTGSANWKTFKKNIKFVEISNSSILESNTHVE